MTEVIVTAKKWGNSLGITIPAETVQEMGIKPDDKVLIKVQRINKIKELFGTMNTKRTTEQIMKEIKKGWN